MLKSWLSALDPKTLEQGRQAQVPAEAGARKRPYRSFGESFRQRPLITRICRLGPVALARDVTIGPPIVAGAVYASPGGRAPTPGTGRYGAVRSSLTRPARP